MSPTIAVHWMRSFMNSGDRAADYFSSFAMPRREGTLKKRFANLDCKDLLVYGKSGYIDGASALSGVVVNLDTRRSIAYSIFCNEQRGGAFNLNAARALQESAVAAVAQYTRMPKPSAQPIAIGH
jgi:D-alanyl-D-alanine carboxypeptidase